MLAAMGADGALSDGTKEALVARVAAEAAQRRWTPAELEWARWAPSDAPAVTEAPASAGEGGAASQDGLSA
jgi:hypothetical protein